MITSRQNERIKELRKLRDKKHRADSGLFAAEGEDLVRAALAADWSPAALFCAPDAPADLLARADAEPVDGDVLDSACALGSGSRVIGVFSQRWSTLDERFALAVFLDAIADPGNVGTVLRAALALADGPVILGPGCADPFSPKAVRASMGAVFSRPPARAEVGDLTALPLRRIALDAAAPVDLREAAPGGPAVIMVGAERDGLSAAASAAATGRAAIPMRPGGPGSLNAAIAAAIALYEFAGALQSDVHAVTADAAATGNPDRAEK